MLGFATIFSALSDRCPTLPAVILGLADWLPELTWRNVGLGVLIVVVTFVVATGLVSFVVVKLPATYFHPDHDREVLKDKHPTIRWAGIIGKNLAGVILIVLGVVMSLPGVPGPGLLTILFGVMLVDFPGKRRLEQKFVSQPRVLKAINDLRKRFGGQPMKL
ncbi:MAG: hypothetical protein ACXWID_05550 [Pyrinomonadaceae bacterium]